MERMLAGALAGVLLFSSACGVLGAGKVAGPQLGQPWSLPLAANVSADLVWIPPGTFVMGSPANEAGRSRNGDEGPQTQVTLTKGFWLEKTFVTIGQWKSVTGRGVREQLLKGINDETLYTLNGKQQLLRDFMVWAKDADPSKYLGNEDDNLPMYFVSWNDAMEFCAQLTAREKATGRLPEGYAYTLPTEAQWEYAARAGTTGPTYAGPNSAENLKAISWYNGNAAEGYTGRAVSKNAGPRDVALKQPNVWGLYDMLGNIWQWCRDWYVPALPGGSVTDPLGPATGTGHVNKGGSFGSGTADERAARRASNPPAEESAYRGFRLALAPTQ
ncbi:MAG TPA: formylglycine-generating enzyme family protein [Opitutales bacterium]|nr:formylglycine-generating enzyme family protein [Opitutales bacterium]